MTLERTPCPVRSVLVLHTQHTHTHTHSDTLFYEDFSLADYLAAFFKSPAVSSGGGFIPYYTCPDHGI